MIKKSVFTGLIISFLSISLSSCLTPDNINLTEIEKKAHIDSVFQMEFKKIQPTIDNGCGENYEKLVNRAVDSLVNVYLDSTQYEY